MGYRVCFPFTLAAGATLTQDCNIDFPTFKTLQGLTVQVTNLTSNAPVIIQLGTTKTGGADCTVYDLVKKKTEETASESWYTFAWDYTTQQVQVCITNLDSQSNNYYATITSGHFD